MRPFGVVLVHERVEANIGRRGFRGRSFERQMHPIVAAVLLRLPEAIRLRRWPRRSHHTNLLRRPSPLGAAKGTPLSVRIAKGSPNSLNAVEAAKREKRLLGGQGFAYDQGDWLGKWVIGADNSNGGCQGGFSLVIGAP